MLARAGKARDASAMLTSALQLAEQKGSEVGARRASNWLGQLHRAMPFDIHEQPS